ncbi:hypothetical protein RI367_004798 [Sorochytrium milnesiophthora]
MPPHTRSHPSSSITSHSDDLDSWDAMSRASAESTATLVTLGAPSSDAAGPSSAAVRDAEISLPPVALPPLNLPVLSSLAAPVSSLPPPLPETSTAARTDHHLPPPPAQSVVADAEPFDEGSMLAHASVWEWGFQKVTDLVSALATPDVDIAVANPGLSSDSSLPAPVHADNRPAKPVTPTFAPTLADSATATASTDEASAAASTRGGSVKSLFWHLASLIPSNIDNLVNALDDRSSPGDTSPTGPGDALLLEDESSEYAPRSHRHYPPRRPASSSSSASHLPSIVGESQPTPSVYARAAVAVHNDAMDTLGVRTLGYRSRDYDDMGHYGLDMQT